MVPDARQKHGSTGKVSYAVTNLSAKADEDKFSINTSYKLSDSSKDICSFGVFDGIFKIITIILRNRITIQFV